MSHSQLLVLFFLTVHSFSILGCKNVISLILVLTICGCPRVCLLLLFLGLIICNSEALPSVHPSWQAVCEAGSFPSDWWEEGLLLTPCGPVTALWFLQVELSVPWTVVPLMCSWTGRGLCGPPLCCL